DPPPQPPSPPPHPPPPHPTRLPTRPPCPPAPPAMLSVSEELVKPLPERAAPPLHPVPDLGLELFRLCLLLRREDLPRLGTRVRGGDGNIGLNRRQLRRFRPDRRIVQFVGHDRVVQRLVRRARAAGQRRPFVLVCGGNVLELVALRVRQVEPRSEHAQQTHRTVEAGSKEAAPPHRSTRAA